MALEILGALAVAALVLWLVFEPLFVAPSPALLVSEPEAAEETRRGLALLALKEIEFDQATGKLSDQDYELLKERYGSEALAALAEEEAHAARRAMVEDPEALIAAHRLQLGSRQGSGSPAAPSCSLCGPRPEPDAVFCSTCGRPIGAAFCTSCGTPIQSDGRFCAGCGTKVAA
ncbi:MAG TPA: zinc ribbon domain-containing protein [Gemmatimonadales bacterium]